MFQHNPDDGIRIGDVTLPLSMWVLDEPGYALPAGYIGSEYRPGVRHFIHTDDTAVPLPLEDAVKDGYLAKEIEYARAIAVREQMAADGREPIGLPDMRYTVLTCPEYVEDALHVEFTLAGGDDYLAFIPDAGTVLVFLRASAPAGTEALMQAVVDAHDPAFLLRSASTLPNDGVQAVTVTVHVPKATQGDVVTLTVDEETLEAVSLDAALSGQVSIVTTAAPGTVFSIDAAGFACDAVTLEVING